MASKKYIILVLLTALTACVCGCGAKKASPVPEARGEFKFTVLKAGQADAIIMRTENGCVIVDCGEKDDGDEIAEYLEDNGIETVDYLFITHFDKDHVGGVPETLDGARVERIITPAYEGDSGEYYDYLAAAEKHNISPELIRENMFFTLDDALFEVYPPKKSSYSEGDNDHSLAISVTHGGNRFLFTGDAEKERMTEILDQAVGEYDFLKVPHHGRYNKYLKTFLEAVKPEYAVVTDSEKNPAEDKTLSALINIGCKVYQTKDGDISVESDGKKIIIN